MHNIPDLCGIVRLSIRLGISRAWLKAEADAGRIPSLKAGAKRLFNPAAVERVLALRAAEGEREEVTA